MKQENPNSVAARRYAMSFRKRCLTLATAFVCIVCLGRPVWTQDATPQALEKAQRVFSAGHSFHFFVPDILVEVAKSGGYKDHEKAGLQALGGSRVIQHWDLAEEKNKAKAALKTGKVDVLTLSPIYPPDDGIDNFITLALEHNPNIRVTLQENWLPFDLYLHFLTKPQIKLPA